LVADARPNSDGTQKSIPLVTGRRRRRRHRHGATPRPRPRRRRGGTRRSSIASRRIPPSRRPVHSDVARSSMALALQMLQSRSYFSGAWRVVLDDARSAPHHPEKGRPTAEHECPWEANACSRGCSSPRALRSTAPPRSWRGARCRSSAGASSRARPSPSTCTLTPRSLR